MANFSMPYPALIAFGWIAYFLYSNRTWFAVKFYHAKIRSGDYDSAFRRLRWVRFAIPKINALGLESSALLLAGRAAQAEPLIRQAMALLKAGSRMPRERLCSLLGHAYTALERYDEAEEWPEQAIRAGDVTGNSQNGLAQLRLRQGRAREALALANLAIEVAEPRANRKVPVVHYADLTWAQAACPHGIASVWRTGCVESRPLSAAALALPTFSGLPACGRRPDRATLSCMLGNSLLTA